MTTFHVVAFGDARAELWGVSWIPATGNPARLAVRQGSVAAFLEGRLESTSPDEAWRFEGDDVSLTFELTGPPTRGHDAEGHLELREQLCEVEGQVRVKSAQAEVRCLGWRSAVEGDSELGQSGSFRYLAGWLERDFGFSLLALRRRRARSHEADMVAAAVVEEPPSPPVDEPRLSTTYTDAGSPIRAGLELWLGARGEDSEPPQHSRRAAGEATGPVVEWSQDKTELQAVPMRWHSHGRAGPGIYLLGRRR